MDDGRGEGDLILAPTGFDMGGIPGFDIVQRLPTSPDTCNACSTVTTLCFSAATSL
jgi:hypothetical protein